MTKLKSSQLWARHEKQHSLEKLILLEKIEDSRKRGRPNLRWIDPRKKLRHASTRLSRLVGTGHCGHHSQGRQE